MIDGWLGSWAADIRGDTPKWHERRQARYNFLEMFVFALIGILCGLLGAAFNHFNGRLTRLWWVEVQSLMQILYLLMSLLVGPVHHIPDRFKVAQERRGPNWLQALSGGLMQLNFTFRVGRAVVVSFFVGPYWLGNSWYSWYSRVLELWIAVTGALCDFHHCLIEILGASSVPSDQRGRQAVSVQGMLGSCWKRMACCFFSSLCRDIVRSVHLIGWHPLIFEKLSETEQLWMEGGQHSISALVLLGQFLICLERSKAIAACFYHSNSVW